MGSSNSKLSKRDIEKITGSEAREVNQESIFKKAAKSGSRRLSKTNSNDNIHSLSSLPRSVSDSKLLEDSARPSRTPRVCQSKNAEVTNELSTSHEEVLPPNALRRERKSIISVRQAQTLENSSRNSHKLSRSQNSKSYTSYNRPRTMSKAYVPSESKLRTVSNRCLSVSDGAIIPSTSLKRKKMAGDIILDMAD